MHRYEWTLHRASTHAHARTHTHTRTHTYTNTHTHRFEGTLHRTSTHTHTHTHTHTNTHKQTQTHTHTHTHTQVRVDPASRVYNRMVCVCVSACLRFFFPNSVSVYIFLSVYFFLKECMRYLCSALSLEYLFLFLFCFS